MSNNKGALKQGKKNKMYRIEAKATTDNVESSVKNTVHNCICVTIYVCVHMCADVRLCSRERKGSDGKSSEESKNRKQI